MCKSFCDTIFFLSLIFFCFYFAFSSIMRPKNGSLCLRVKAVEQTPSRLVLSPVTYTFTFISWCEMPSSQRRQTQILLIPHRFGIRKIKSFSIIFWVGFFSLPDELSSKREKNGKKKRFGNIEMVYIYTFFWAKLNLAHIEVVDFTLIRFIFGASFFFSSFFIRSFAFVLIGKKS